MYLRPSQPAVVPCRVTNPQAKVSLLREVPPEEVTSNNTLVTYDPTKGFLLQSPSRELQGVFYCKAETRGTPQISTKYQLLYVEGGHPPTAGRSDRERSDGDAVVCLWQFRANPRTSAWRCLRSR